MVIAKDVATGHLLERRTEIPNIEIISHYFGVNWARTRRAYNTDLSCYIVHPNQGLMDAFGFSAELALFIPHFDAIEPRFFQALNQCLSEDPLSGRVDRTTFLIVCNSEQNRQSVEKYVSEFAPGWIAIVLVAPELRLLRRGAWAMHALISKQVYVRDVFDETLPLRTDIQFFGREALIHDFRQAALASQNRGLFGLRKTGKTSLLFKVDRTLKLDEKITMLYYDCKKPSIRRLRWQQLLDRICDDLLHALGRKPSSYKELPPDTRIERIIQDAGANRRFCVIFDEIEFISFLSRRDPHWREDFVDLWQTFWSLQSESRSICFFICGLNPSVVEVDRIDGVQNPLFSIVKSTYLTGFSPDEAAAMVGQIGSRIGMSFEPETLAELQERFGGHPLLIRKACSFLHNVFNARGVPRPAIVTRAFMADIKEEMDSSLETYFAHVLSELQEFYPDEYEALLMTVSGETLDFTALAADATYVRHLRDYGLIAVDPRNHLPAFRIACLRAYLERENARREKRPYRVRIVTRNRQEWLTMRTLQLAKDLRRLSQSVREKKSFYLLHADAINVPEELATMTSATDVATFENFINIAYRCFVEAIDQAGKKQKIEKFPFTLLKQELPHLAVAMHRLRAYRHLRFHSEHTPEVREAIRAFMKGDIGKDQPTANDDYRALQQICLDELALAVQVETANISD